MKKFWKVFAFVLVLSGVAFAGAIKTWVSGETLTAADLNSNFAHIHNTMVGGHGARLVNADVSASAAISHTKMATPALLPKAWAYVAASCGASPCTVAAGSGIASITRASAGSYVVNLSAARANTTYAPMVTSVVGGGTDTWCTAGINTTSQFVVRCNDGAVPTATDCGFSVIVMDDDN